VTGQVGLTDHADRLLTLHDRQSADLVFLHDVQDLCDVCLRVDNDRHALSQLARSGARWVSAAGDALGDYVAVSDYAPQAIVVPADRERSDIEVSHLLGRVLQCLVLADARRASVHDVPGCRHHIPPRSGWGIPPASAFIVGCFRTKRPAH
jgi:hypothetical protein